MSKIITQKCKVENCNGLGKLDNRVKSRHFIKGYCGKHYERFRIYGDAYYSKEDGRSSHNLYTVWSAMWQRCENKNSSVYKHYGARGISVAECWRGRIGFDNFIKDMGDKPTVKHSIDRIDNNKGYSPDNCRWATWHQQHSNRRNNSKRVGVNWDNIRKRWVASLTINGVAYQKRFESITDAILYREELENKFLN